MRVCVCAYVICMYVCVFVGGRVDAFLRLICHLNLSVCIFEDFFRIVANVAAE